MYTKETHTGIQKRPTQVYKRDLPNNHVRTATHYKRPSNTYTSLYVNREVLLFPLRVYVLEGREEYVFSFSFVYVFDEREVHRQTKKTCQIIMKRHSPTTVTTETLNDKHKRDLYRHTKETHTDMQQSFAK